jgi:hypothetical protein
MTNSEASKSTRPVMALRMSVIPGCLVFRHGFQIVLLAIQQMSQLDLFITTPKKKPTKV